MTRLALPPAGVWPNITESAWQGQILSLARSLGYALSYHTWGSIHSTAGFPDLVLVRTAGRLRPGRIVFVELKAIARGRVSPDQLAWLEGIRAAGGEAYCWWTWPDDEAEAGTILSLTVPPDPLPPLRLLNPRLAV